MNTTLAISIRSSIKEGHEDAQKLAVKERKEDIMGIVEVKDTRAIKDTRAARDTNITRKARDTMMTGIQDRLDLEDQEEDTTLLEVGQMRDFSLWRILCSYYTI